MITCPKCHTELSDDTRFCSHCGAPVHAYVFCPQCGAGNDATFSFCQKCGSALSVPAAKEAAPSAATPEAAPSAAAPEAAADYSNSQAVQPAAENGTPAAAAAAPVNEVSQETAAAPAKENPLKKIPPKVLMFGGIGVVAVIAVILLIVILSGGKKNRILYIRDDELFTAKTSEDSSEQISSRLLSSGFSFDMDYSDMSYTLGEMVTFNEDRSRIFFPDKIDGTSNGVAVYYNSTRSLDDDPTKVDSDILSYAIDKSGQKIAYIKGSGNNLYISDLEDKEKIAGNIRCFYPNEDLTKIIFMNDENDFYVWTEDDDKEKIASSISSVVKISDDFKTVYYLKDEALYRQSTDEDDKEKLASDISTNFIKIYDSGEMYYIKDETEAKALMEYVTDDMASSDAYMTEPEYPTYPDSPVYPSWWDYSTDEEYNKAVSQYENDYAEYEKTCDRLSEDYEAAREEYYQKLDRDNLRADLNEVIEIPSYVLYYFNGEEEITVSENLASAYINIYSNSAPVLVAPLRDSAYIPNIKLSEIDSSYEVEELLNSSIYSESEESLIISGEIFPVDCDPEYPELSLSPDGTAIYYIKDYEHDGGDLYVSSIRGGEPEEPEFYDSDVSAIIPSFTPDGELMYFKNFDNDTNSGDLYIEKENVDYDVYYGFYFMGDDIVYLTDCDFDTVTATLNYYNGSKKSEIADDVRDIVIDNDTVFYINDYNAYSNTGTLCCSDGGDSVELDEDVSILISPTAGRVKAVNYNYKMYFYSN